MQKQLILLDQSALKKSHCSRLLYWTLLKSYRKPLNDHAAEWGSGFHLYAKLLEETGGDNIVAMQKAVECFKKNNYIPDRKKQHLTADTLAYTCQSYFDGPFQNDSFDTLKDINDLGENNTQFPKGRPLVEKRFALDLYESDICKILLCGTMDKIVVHRTSKILAIGDYKTSSVWNDTAYLDSYQLNNQLPTYIYALKRLINESDSSSVLHQYKGHEIRGFIDGIFPSNNKTGGFSVEFKRSRVFEFKESDLIEYETMLYGICYDIENILSNTITAMPFREGIINNTCGMFGGCSFADVCINEWDKDRQQFILDKNFMVKPYNPMSHGE